MIYKGIIKERDIKKKAFLFIGCIVLLYVEFLQQNYLYMAVTLIVCLAIFLKKEHVVSDEGIEIRYNLLGLKVSNKWGWEQITVIRPNFSRAKPNILLEIAKDITVRPFVFKPEDAWDVMEFAKKMNAEIYVDDRTEEERKRDQETAETRLRHAQVKKAAKTRNHKNKSR